MRRRTFALSLTLSAVAVTVIALVYGTSRQSEPSPGEAEQTPQASLTSTEPNAATVVPPSPERAATQTVSNTDLPDHSPLPNANPPRADLPLPDEETFRKRSREYQTPEVQLTYGLLLEHLGLTAQEKDALLSLLIDMRVEGGTFVSHGKVIFPGRTQSEDERLNRIAAVIGDAKLQQFLELERDLRSYVEVGRLGAVLEYDGAPLTDAQRDGLFKIVADVRHHESKPAVNFDPFSIASLEDELARRSEFERHVVELVPSVLAPNQVVYLDEQYQALSYKRTTDLERDKIEKGD